MIMRKRVLTTRQTIDVAGPEGHEKNTKKKKKKRRNGRRRPPPPVCRAEAVMSAPLMLGPKCVFQQ